MFCMGVSASETHSQKNTGMSIAEATDRIIATAKAASGGQSSAGFGAIGVWLWIRRRGPA